LILPPPMSLPRLARTPNARPCLFLCCIQSERIQSANLAFLAFTLSLPVCWEAVSRVKRRSPIWRLHSCSFPCLCRRCARPQVGEAPASRSWAI
jgi:hypothetical protein